MPIIIPSSNIYTMDRKKGIDNRIKAVSYTKTKYSIKQESKAVNFKAQGAGMLSANSDSIENGNSANYSPDGLHTYAACAYASYTNYNYKKYKITIPRVGNNEAVRNINLSDENAVTISKTFLRYACDATFYAIRKSGNLIVTRIRTSNLKDEDWSSEIPQNLSIEYNYDPTIPDDVVSASVDFLAPHESVAINASETDEEKIVLDIVTLSDVLTCKCRGDWDVFGPDPSEIRIERRFAPLGNVVNQYSLADISISINGVVVLFDKIEEELVYPAESQHADLSVESNEFLQFDESSVYEEKSATATLTFELNDISTGQYTSQNYNATIEIDGEPTTSFGSLQHILSYGNPDAAEWFFNVSGLYSIFNDNGYSFSIDGSCDVTATSGTTLNATGYVSKGYNSDAEIVIYDNLPPPAPVYITITLYGKAIKDKARYIFDYVVQEYQNGKETATLRCDIKDYFDSEGTKVISSDNSTGQMAFDIYDEVIPMRRNASGVDVPMSYYRDGTPKVFKVLGSKVYYDGAVWQEISLQEV